MKIYMAYSKCSKVSNSLTFLSANKMLAIIYISALEVIKSLSEWQTGKTLIRRLLQKQSDLGLHFLSIPFWQAASV